MGVRARGGGGCSPIESGKAMIFRANCKSAAKTKKYFWYLIFIKRKDQNNHSVHQDEVPESVRFLPIIIIIKWRELGKQFWIKVYCLPCEQFQLFDSMLFGQVRWTVFSGSVKIFLRAKMAQLPRKKNWTPMWLKNRHSRNLSTWIQLCYS